MRLGQTVRRVVIGACIALTACGGADGGFETLPTTPRPETTTPPTTVDATTTVATSAVPITALDTTTTISIEDEVLVGFAEIEANIAACLAAPPACHARTVAFEGSPAFDWFDGLMSSYARDGLIGRDVGLRYHVTESVSVGLDGRSAVVRLCGVDGNWLVDPGPSDGPDDDIVVDDSVLSWRQDLELVLTSEGWRRSGGRDLENWPGENRCPEH
ncbi:MAG: hypothetical protein AB7Q42_00145 [Acidimicrobiia bacterium]